MDLFAISTNDLKLFSNLHEAIFFHVVLGLLCLAEVVKGLYVASGNRQHTRDLSLWFVIGAWVWGVSAGGFFRGADMPLWVQNLLLPHFFFYPGLVLVLLGIVIRSAAVVTLGRAFTHNVQTTDDQKLIQSGLYRWVRNPAYTGSILSLIGVTLAYRSVIALLSVVAVCALCYGLRIRVEERALRSQFGPQFENYCRKVKYRLFPGLY